MQKSVYINATGVFLPCEAIDNENIESHLGLVHGKASRFKNKILKSNGILTRHYAIDNQHRTLFHNHQLAALAIANAFEKNHLAMENIDLLSVATTQGELLVPGFASLVHGELGWSPLEIANFQSVCASGIMALQNAYCQLLAGEKSKAVVCASEFASRLFKNTQFEIHTHQPDFESEFLRWMLSDGAGAWVLETKPHAHQLSLKIEWIDLKSFANFQPVCMYYGSKDNEKFWMDYPDVVAAAKDGAFHLRQNIRILDNMVKYGVQRFLELIDANKININEIDWFLCHYSSHIFRGQIVDLLEKGGASIPEEKWFTNLYTKGNTGSASIFIMLDELLQQGKIKAGDKILCMVPESGRFVTGFVYLTVVAPLNESVAAEAYRVPEAPKVEMPQTSHHQWLVRELTRIWIDFEAKLAQVPIVRKIYSGTLTLEEYRLLLLNIRQQVIDGSQWIARAASNFSIDMFELRSAFLRHAGTEHRDYQILERNFVAVGGDLEAMYQNEKNIGSEALSGWMFHRANQANPIDLLGAMFIIEGLGNRMAGHWGKLIQRQLKLADEQVSFLSYHGEADVAHFKRLEDALETPFINEEAVRKIAKTAKTCARLYLMQLEELGNY